jgi:hypothetical protein
MILPIIQLPKQVQQTKKLITYSSFVPLSLIEKETNEIWTIFSVDGECKYFWCFDKFGNIRDIYHSELTSGKYKILVDKENSK